MGHVQTVKNLSKKYLRWDFLVSPHHLAPAALLAIVLELFINIWIIERVPYTEIDWKAYMQECEGFVNGTYDYSELRGDTGPLVYPAGFVYIYTAFYYVTSYGRNVKLAQYAFLVVYLLQLCLVFRVYVKTSKVPPYVLLLSILTSYRIHSIYVLRLFNDPITVLLLYASLNLFLDSFYTIGSIFFSLAVSVKMNILLYAPALLIFYLTNLGLKNTVKNIAICAAVQAILGLPFLLTHPVNYLKGSFDIGRVFNHTWTVNYRFLDVDVFEHRFFHVSLMVVHLIVLAIFFPMLKQYFESFCRLKSVQSQVQLQIDRKNRELIDERATKKPNKKAKHRKTPSDLTKDQMDFLNSFESSLKTEHEKHKEKEPENELYNINFNSINQLFVLPMFLCNFIGILCSRSLHYQFYSWYFHSLPYLMWCTPYSLIVRFLILALIEMCWNTYPSTVYSSVLLHACHLFVIVGIYRVLNKRNTMVKDHVN